jgi:hypothetical protein
MATCKIKEKYKWIECNRPPLEGDPEGLCLLHSRQADKDKEGAFTKAVKAKLAQEDYDFRGVFFPGEADFSGHEFKKGADFFGATFSGDAYFSEATFSEDTDFSGATFSGDAGFSGATFSGEALFSTTEFQQPASFSACQIRNQLVLDTINPARQGKPRKIFQADFSYIRFFDQGRLRFQDLSLAHATLSGTDLLQCRFNNVDWHPFRGRQAVYDEVRLYENGKYRKAEKPSNEQYARVEECYRYLKLNYEGAGDFKKAGDFHYGEMEMHRRASKWRWLPIYWYNLYRFLSGYGERPLRALLVLAGFLVLFTLGFSGAEGNLTLAWPSGRFWQDCLYILQKATFQRPERQIGSHWGQWLATLSPLLLPGQAALFLLALRNRLGRRR